MPMQYMSMQWLHVYAEGSLVLVLIFGSFPSIRFGAKCLVNFGPVRIFLVNILSCEILSPMRKRVITWIVSLNAKTTEGKIYAKYFLFSFLKEGKASLLCPVETDFQRSVAIQALAGCSGCFDLCASKLCRSGWRLLNITIYVIIRTV